VLTRAVVHVERELEPASLPRGAERRDDLRRERRKLHRVELSTEEEREILLTEIGVIDPALSRCVLM